jgi:O-antigen/teichoic acid export membrane protein
MNNVKNSNTFQALWVAVGSFTSFATSMLTVAILSRYLDKIEYGTYRQIVYIYFTLLVVFSAGLPHVFSYFLPRNNIKYGRDIVMKITKILGVSGIVFSALLFSFSGLIAIALKNPELSIGLKYFSPIPMLLLPTIGVEGIFATYKKTKHIAVFNVITRIVMLICIVTPIVFYRASYEIAICGWLISSVFTLILALYFKNIPFIATINIKAELPYSKILKYSIPLASAGIFGIAIKFSDQFYISRFFGTEVFAEFSNGFIELPLVTMVTTAVSTVLMPVFTKMIKDNVDSKEITVIWKNAILKSAYIIYPLLIFFIFHAKIIVTILYSEVYVNSAVYFQIAMAANFFNIIVFAPLLFAMGKTKFYSNLHLIFAISAWSFGYLILLLFNSPVAIAVISVLLSIIKVIVFVVYTSNKLNIKFASLFPLRDFFLIIVQSTVFVFGINFMLDNINIVENLILKMFLSFVIFLISIIITSSILNLKHLDYLQPLFLKIKKHVILKK